MEQTVKKKFGIRHCSDGVPILKDRGRVSRFCHCQGN